MLLFVQPNNVLLKKERQKEHSTDRHTQPRRQTGISRSPLFFRLTYKKKDRKNTAQTGIHNQEDRRVVRVLYSLGLLLQEDGQTAIEKDFPHFYRTQMQYFFC